MIEELARRLSPGSVLTADGARLGFARDCWPQALGWDLSRRRAHEPSAVIRPRDEEEVAAALEWSARRGAVLVPRGAGSGVVGAAIGTGRDFHVLDVSRLSERFELVLEGQAPVVRAGAGMRGAELERRLNALGWSLLHFPQSMGESSVGGWIAADSFGQLSTRYGGVRAQARSLRVADLSGAVRDEAPAAHLGAEGTLGVLTEVSLRVRPLPRSRRFYALGFSSREEALQFARAAAAAATPPSVLRLYSPADALFNGLRGGGAGSSAAAWRRRAENFFLRRAGWLNALAPLAGRAWLAVLIYEDEEPFGSDGPPGGGKSLGESPARRWWERRYHLSRARLEETFSAGCFADTVDFWAPWDLLGPLERETLGVLRRHAFAFSHFSHFDSEGGCLYVTFAGSGGADVHARSWKEALDACSRLGARVNHHHGVGLAKLPWLGSARGAAWLENWKAQKRSRDPQGLLNPGKLCP